MVRLAALGAPYLLHYDLSQPPALWGVSQTRCTLLALLSGDLATVLQVLQRGVAHESHAEFVRRLQSPR
jgi:hypothetical protein